MLNHGLPSGSYTWIQGSHVIFGRRHHNLALLAGVRIGRPDQSTSMPTPRSCRRRIVNIEDLRKAAKRRLPRAVFDYIDGGADGEITLA